MKYEIAADFLAVIRINRLPAGFFGFEFLVQAQRFHVGKRVAERSDLQCASGVFSKRRWRSRSLQCLKLEGVILVSRRGSEGGPVTLPVFKTGDWRLAVSMVRSTRTRFRQDFECVAGERNSRHSVVLGDTATGHICGMRAGLWARK